MTIFRTQCRRLELGLTRLILAWLRTATAGDNGEIGVLGLIFFVAAFLGIAIAVTAAIKLKVTTLLTQIPG